MLQFIYWHQTLNWTLQPYPLATAIIMLNYVPTKHSTYETHLQGVSFIENF